MIKLLTFDPQSLTYVRRQLRAHNRRLVTDYRLHRPTEEAAIEMWVSAESRWMLTAQFAACAAVRFV